MYSTARSVRTSTASPLAPLNPAPNSSRVTAFRIMSWGILGSGPMSSPNSTCPSPATPSLPSHLNPPPFSPSRTAAASAAVPGVPGVPGVAGVTGEDGSFGDRRFGVFEGCGSSSLSKNSNGSGNFSTNLRSSCSSFFPPPALSNPTPFLSPLAWDVGDNVVGTAAEAAASEARRACRIARRRPRGDFSRPLGIPQLFEEWGRPTEGAGDGSCRRRFEGRGLNASRSPN
mmetsp:Transcript_15127/g.29739  ORF Transcript_15127/g.29739 Transcript_15127/m.29739 type:complete len:229 (-) Transcript_15127:170-856(-)